MRPFLPSHVVFFRVKAFFSDELCIYFTLKIYVMLEMLRLFCPDFAGELRQLYWLCTNLGEPLESQPFV